MIKTCKIVTGIYDTLVSPTMLGAGSSYATKGHDFRLQKIRARYDLRKTISLIELLICGILCRVKSSLQNL